MHADRSRSFVKRPPTACVASATPVEDELEGFPKRGGGAGPQYELAGAAAAAACEQALPPPPPPPPLHSTYPPLPPSAPPPIHPLPLALPPCRHRRHRAPTHLAQDGCLPDGSSPFGNGALWLMHNGEGAEVPLCAQPPVVPGARRGGTDAANAATWRFVPAAEGGGGGTELFHLEAFDRPGHLLSLDEGGTVRLLPRPADGPPPVTQAWRRTPCPTGSGEGEGEGGSVHLESAARPGQYLTLVRQVDAGCNPRCQRLQPRWMRHTPLSCCAP